MNYGINSLSVLPVRLEPDHKSEMINQLLFGEQFTILDKNGDWLQIEGSLDAYQGWINSDGVFPLENTPLTEIKADEVNTNPLRVSPVDHPHSSFLILPGSTLPGYNKANGEFFIGGIKYKALGPISTDEEISGRDKLVRSAVIFLNAPYLWGGRGLFGIDCSGLVQVAYKICGTAIPRDASQQVKSGRALSFASEAQAGDLAFFAEPEEEISHVGMIIGQDKIIHSSGKVRIDNFDHQGIYKKETQDYSHHLRVIHRYLEG